MAIPCVHNAKQASATRSMLHRKVRPPLMRLALLVFAACVLAASGSSSWINFRVYNEDPSSGTLSLQLNGQPVSSIALHSCNEEIITVEFNPSAIGTVTVSACILEYVAQYALVGFHFLQLNSVTGNAVIFSWTPHAYNFGHEYTLVALPGSVQQLIDVNTVKHNDGIDVARLRVGDVEPHFGRCIVQLALF